MLNLKLFTKKSFKKIFAKTIVLLIVSCFIAGDMHAYSTIGRLFNNAKKNFQNFRNRWRKKEPAFPHRRSSVEKPSFGEKPNFEDKTAPSPVWSAEPEPESFIPVSPITQPHLNPIPKNASVESVVKIISEANPKTIDSIKKELKKSLSSLSKDEIDHIFTLLELHNKAHIEKLLKDESSFLDALTSAYDDYVKKINEPTQPSQPSWLAIQGLSNQEKNFILNTRYFPQKPKKPLIRTKKAMEEYNKKSWEYSKLIIGNMVRLNKIIKDNPQEHAAIVALLKKNKKWKPYLKYIENPAVRDQLGKDAINKDIIKSMTEKLATNDTTLKITDTEKKDLTAAFKKISNNELKVLKKNMDKLKKPSDYNLFVRYNSYRSKIQILANENALTEEQRKILGVTALPKKIA